MCMNTCICEFGGQNAGLLGLSRAGYELVVKAAPIGPSQPYGCIMACAVSCGVSKYHSVTTVIICCSVNIAPATWAQSWNRGRQTLKHATPHHHHSRSVKNLSAMQIEQERALFERNPSNQFCICWHHVSFSPAVKCTIRESSSAWQATSNQASSYQVTNKTSS